MSLSVYNIVCVVWAGFNTLCEKAFYCSGFVVGVIHGVFLCTFSASADSRQKARTGDADVGHHRRPGTETVQATQLAHTTVHPQY